MSKAEKNTGVVGHRRTGIQIMGQLIGLVRPVAGHVCGDFAGSDRLSLRDFPHDSGRIWDDSRDSIGIGS